MTHPSTYLHFNGAKTTPDLLIVSSDNSANTKRIILDDPGSGHRPVIAKVTLSQRQRILDPYIRTSWNFKKANWRNFTDMLERNLHQERIDFSQNPDKIGKVITSSNINCAKTCIPRGRVKRYKCFWTNDLETLKNQREYLRKRAEHTGKIEDVQAWRKQAAILRREITQSKRKSFQNFISHINYQKDSQKTYKYLAEIQNSTSCSNKVPRLIHIKIAKAYGTISYDASCVTAGIRPTQITIEQKVQTYVATKINHLEYDAPFEVEYCRHPAELAIIHKVENGTMYTNEVYTDSSKI